MPKHLADNENIHPVEGGGDNDAQRTFTSAQLFDGQTEIQILHEQAIYRLRITRQGKLILNK